jgi:hypothetical protein
MATDEPVRVITGATAGIGHAGRPIDPPKSTRDVDVQHRLWQVSEQLTGLA